MVVVDTFDTISGGERREERFVNQSVTGVTWS